jgi:DNA-binding protein Fis
MHSMVLATADDHVADAILGLLAGRGRSATWARTWGELLARVIREDVRIVLVDPGLPGAVPAVLEALCGSLPSAPEIRSWNMAWGAFSPIAANELLRWAGKRASDPFDADERKWLPRAGIGSEPYSILRELAENPLPIRFVGERGTGKERVARIVHRIAWPDERRFVPVHETDAVVMREGAPGTLFFVDADEWVPGSVERAMVLAEASGWRVMAGYHRIAAAVGWQTSPIVPLRERPADIDALFAWYVDRWRRRLGRGKLTTAPELLARMQAYSWPQNLRELETFAVEVASAATGRRAGSDTLPAKVLERLDGRSDEDAAFEATITARLRPLVQRHVRIEGLPSLHQTVIDATERVLFRMVLDRCEGNQKAAAILLGVSRNTLRERMSRLHLDG